jgi:NRPS condensation-like uncharacterized protein
MVSSSSTAVSLHVSPIEATLWGASQFYGHLGIHAAVDLKRSVSRDELEAACAGVVADFPVMGATYNQGFWRDRWVSSDAPIAELVRVEEVEDLEEATRRWISVQLDPERERPLRVVALEAEGRTRLLFSLLHLAVDGGGTMAIARSFACHLYGVPSEIPPGPRRDVGQAFEAMRWYHLPLLAWGIVREGLRPIPLLLTRPRLPPFAERAQGGPGRWARVQVSADQLQALKERCRASGASVNDVLVAALARANRERAQGANTVVAYTIDLRRYLTRPRLLATNLSWVQFASIPLRGIESLEEAAGTVKGVTSAHQRSLYGLSALAQARLLTALAPHAFVHLVGRRFMVPLLEAIARRSTVVTNVGRLDAGLEVFGDDIDKLQIIGPTFDRFGIPLVAATGFRGGLALDVYVPPNLDEDLLDAYITDLRAAFE